MDPTLAEENHDTAIVYVRIYDIIDDDSSTKVGSLLLILAKIAIKLKKYGSENVCLSGLVFTTSVHLSLLNQMNTYL